MEGGAAGKSAVAIPIGSWEDCPDADATDADAIKARSDAIDTAKSAVGGDPTKIIVYLGHPGAKDKQDIVKASAAYAQYALTYISAYDADRILLKFAAKGLKWDRPRRGARLQRISLSLSKLTEEQAVVKDIAITFGANVPCLLIPKFQKTVADAGLAEGVKAMLDILRGLCIERDFVINDLHIGNMAIFNGKGVTFDYDMLFTKDPKGPAYGTFMSNLKDIHDYSQQYGDLSQFTHGPSMFITLNMMAEGNERDEFTRMYFCIYDLLSVLASLKVLCMAYGGLSAVETCELALKSNGDTFERRTAAVNALAAALQGVAWPNTTVVKVFDAPPTNNGSMPRPPDASDRVARRSPYGGRRTPRRKGLPRLL